jgi:1-acyl-sn-glycerol-3-phosphate acyltransferase
LFFEAGDGVPMTTVHWGDRKTGMVQATRMIARACLGPFFRMRVRGIGNLPTSCAYVLLVKHQRWEDIPLLGLAVPNPLYYVAKAELFRSPWLGRYLASLGGIPLNRERPVESRRSLRRIVEHLHGGEGMVIFPEGTYYPDRMGPGQTGLVRMVLARTHPPFLPVGIRYGRGARRIVEIRIGEPVPAETGKHVGLFVERMMEKIARLSGL